MKSLVIYDSLYGNTEQIAKAIADALGTPETVTLRHVGDIQPGEMSDLTLLVVGSPTQRFNIKPEMKDFLNAIPDGSLRGVPVAAFDTRYPQSEIDKIPVLAFFAKIWGRSAYADRHIAQALKRKGGGPLLASEGFYVGGMEGPLLEGERERAADWAGQLAAKAVW